MEFKTKFFTRNKGHFVMIKQSSQPEQITIVNIQTSKNRPLHTHESQTERTEGRNR